jgi:hypothetical protein
LPDARRDLAVAGGKHKVTDNARQQSGVFRAGGREGSFCPILADG